MSTTNKKELLFSVTADDCTWSSFCAGGKGGQHQNKTASAVRCVHPLSGAEGISRDHKSQWQNKKLAFTRMSDTAKFRAWLKLQSSRRLLSSEEKRKAINEAENAKLKLEKEVDAMMLPENIKVEIKDAKGKWVPYIPTENNEENIQLL